ncbi:MAG: signal recognition particle-docking protein FtsY [Clostridiaceae bacterium]|nr:signal recognition particle-docking protein FtsY [Clostridiaceae bacterium]
MALFDKFKQGLTKTRDFLMGQVSNIAAALGFFDEEELEELEIALIQADVGAACTDELMTALREKMRISKNRSTEFVLGTLKKEIRGILGEKEQLYLEPGKLNILMMVGVNGTGKTTTAGKMALRFSREGKKVLMCAADTFRAAAIQQLEAWCERTNTPLISQKDGKDPAAVVYDSIKAAQARGSDVLIIDTAGRLHNKKNLMDELGKIRRIIEREAPDAVVQTLLVIDATSGQNAVIQTATFTEVSDVTGLVLTKLDGSAKGGVAVAVAYQSNVPILLAGLGETAEDLVDFDPDAFVDSLLPEEELQKIAKTD